MTQGLETIRSELGDQPGFGTFYFSSKEHTSLGSGAMYSRTTGQSSTPLGSWMGELLAGSPSHVGA